MLLRAYRDGSVPLDRDGWFATGDLGIWRPDGRLHVEGRRGDLIITGGENVWPETVEAALREHPGVVDVAVAGVSDAEWGQRVVAWIVPADPNDPPSLATLRAVVRERLPAFMAPKERVLVDVVPRTAIGKIVRSTLASGHAGSSG
jgi:acyl-CoA synthetase (AMP-forming)/AMP-acid ligase II